MQAAPVSPHLQPLGTLARLQQLGLALGGGQQRGAAKTLSMHLCRELSAALRWDARCSQRCPSRRAAR